MVKEVQQCVLPTGFPAIEKKQVELRQQDGGLGGPRFCPPLKQ